MRIARFASERGPEYGIVELAVDHGEHPDTIQVVSGDPFAGRVRYTGERLALEEVRLLAPVLPRSKVVGVGQNYRSHTNELGWEQPDFPKLFLKPNTSVIGPGEAIIKPTECKQLDYEGELAIVISNICRRVPRERAKDVIFGYTVGNDVTARDLQDPKGPWLRAKGYDTFTVLGPWINAHLSPAEAGQLAITTTVDDEVRQKGKTSEMIWDIPALIEMISGIMTLLPGDVILTGTPAGIGPMEPGQSVSIEIDSIGTLTNPVVAE
ncbi:MAG: fumarylacetoacetate hydrolase family protein [Propionibacteriaceae bacterium]|jgi:2-keto-4-pentenoate hydratase/2-oxohepta-3-ene-1,7-dioic acid hydratase in catechol pathway|nr:fumarylacetoacetate hydrolase family protein [Propionibacteriaceae bacterium]